jgi:hypothetical protein
VEVPRGRLRALARVPQVRYIEEVYFPTTLNDRSRFYTGLSEVADDGFATGLDPSLDGLDDASGFQVKYAHFDSGLEFLHPDFDTADVTFESGADLFDFPSGHGTHTAGSLVGDGGAWASVPETPPASGAVATNRWRGVTPQAALHHMSFENGFGDLQIFERASEVGAQISSNSWGWVTGTGVAIHDYNLNAQMWDEGVWDAQPDPVQGLQPLTVFFSAGNDGGFRPPNGCLSDGPDRVGTPATAKNVITVASNETDRGSGNACGNNSGLGNNVEEISSSSSRGPVDPDGTLRGLFKPDVSNIGGYWVMSTEATNTASACDLQYILPDCPFDCSNTGSEYAYLNGTSMSAPLTAGLGGVLLQDLVVRRGVAQPKPSLIKALLVNGARDLTPGGCDYTFDVGQAVVHQGWGFVQAKNSLYGPGGTPSDRKLALENEVADHAVATGGSYSRRIVVAEGSPLKVTLAWTDYPAAANSVSPLVVNDLDLEVTGPGGTFLGNSFVGNWSVSGGLPGPDRYNVVENVFIQNAPAGTYTIVVRGFQVTQDQEPDKDGVNQDFSLVWSGELVASPICGNEMCELGEDACFCPADCGMPGSAELICDDGKDDDCDGQIDCADSECTTDVACGDFCGDAECNGLEDCVSCAQDCIAGDVACGNGLCEAADGEDCLSCAADCNGLNTGPARYCCGSDTPCTDLRCIADGRACSETPTVPFCCGDGVCEGDETTINCDVDCAIAAGSIPAVYGASEAPLLVSRLQGGELSLSWDASCLASDTDYEVYEGQLGAFYSHVPRTCSTGGASSFSFPVPAGSTYYIVVPRNVSREGSYGLDGDGQERPASAQACFVQQMAPCQ